MMEQRHAETILESLAERIRDLKIEVMLKESVIEQKNKKIAELEKIIEELRHV